MPKTLPPLHAAILALIPKPYPTKKALAEAAGITETTLHNILGGKDPASPTLAKLQKAGVRIANKDLIASLDGAA